jgi:transposase
VGRGCDHPEFCPHCGSIEGNLSRYGKKQQVFMDLPMHGQHVGIIVDRQRFLRKNCGSTFREIIFGIDDDHLCTIRFRQYVEHHSLRRTFVSIAEELGISEGMVRNICNAYIDSLEENRDTATPRWLGIDEIHILGKPRGVIANVEQNTLVDLLIDSIRTPSLAI